MRILGCFLLLSGSILLEARDNPQWGQAWSRNMFSPETNLPSSFDPESGANIKWRAQLGTETHSTPMISGGKVYIGTNNGNPRDPKHQGDRGVLMCFNEADGKFLWQLVVPKREEDPYHDWPKSGISSPVTVEGNRVYLVSNRGEVMCLDAEGLSNGNDGPYKDEGSHLAPAGTSTLQTGSLDADILWLLDLTASAGIWSHDAAHSSILIDGDLLYLNSGTGVDNTHKRIRRPEAPSLVVVDKNTGKYIGREREGIGPNIFHCTWSPPSLATVNGQELLFFAAGNGFIYAFEPLLAPSDKLQTLKKVWQFDFDPTAPKTDVHTFNSNRKESPSNIYGLPVVHDNRLFVAGGGDLFWGKNEAWLKCIDPTQKGDVTKTALVWSYPLQKHVLSSPAIHGELIFIADCGRTFHCVNAKTGATVWTHEIRGEAWGTPLIADGKVYLGTRSGHFYVFSAEREKKVLATLELRTPISATVTAANGTLYLATMTDLFAIAQK